MPTLTETIRTDLTSAMKAREALRVSTLRLVQSMLKNEQIALGHELSDEEAIVVLVRAAKQRQESIEQYGKAGRQDLADKERQEREIIEAYLPKQLSEDEIETIVREAIATTGAQSKKDIGKVMGPIMSRYKGRIDGKKVQEIASRLLG